jgi:hypothetical protein
MTIELTTRTKLPFADGDYVFWLPMARVNAAEHEIGGSILALFHALGENMAESVGGTRVLAGSSEARVKQCQSIIRNALIGGGTPETDARELVDVYCYPARPAMHDVALAWDILHAAVYGVPAWEIAATGEEETTDA